MSSNMYTNSDSGDVVFHEVTAVFLAIEFQVGSKKFHNPLYVPDFLKTFFKEFLGNF